MLHGSLVLGDYVPGRSDVDVLLVVERALTDVEIAGLRELALGLAHERSGGLDFRVVTRSTAAAPSPGPPLELYVGLHPGEEGEVETHVAGEPDLVAELSMARAFGRALAGAEARSVIGPVPDEWVVAYGDEIVGRWQGLTDDDVHTELMVLTSCRVWRFAVEGVYCSKDEAGRWALARDPSLVAVDRALRRRARQADVDIEPAAVAAVLTRVREEIARLAE